MLNRGAASTRAVGGEVKTALGMDEAYEGFGFLDRCRVDVTQEPIEREGRGPGEVGWVLNGLLRCAIHLDHILTLPGCAGGLRRRKIDSRGGRRKRSHETTHSL